MLKGRLGRIRNELVIVSMLLVLLGVALYYKESLCSDLSIHHFYLSDSFRTPVLRFTNISAGRRRGVAVLVHGFQCNKSMMVQLGKFLALHGLDAYTIDLPGHGESNTSFKLGECWEATRQAISEIAALAGVDRREIVVIGHSFGAMVLAVAIERQDIAASIYIGPGEVKNLKPDCLRNVLVITAEHDSRDIKAYAQTIFDTLTCQHLSKPGNGRYGDFSNGTAREWIEVPQTAHVNLILDSGVRYLVVDWCEKSLQTALVQSRPLPTVPTKLAPILSLMISAVFVSLMSKIMPACSHEGWPFFTNPFRIFNIFVWGIFCGIAIFKIYTPPGFLHLREGELFAVPIFSVGLFCLLFFLAFERRIHLGVSLLEIFMALAAFCVLYLGLLPTVDREFFHLSFTFDHPGRLLAFAVVSIGSLPFSLMVERLLRHTQGLFHGFLLGTAASFGAAIAFYAVFGFGILQVAGGLYRFAGVFLAVIVYCTLVGAIFYHTRRSLIPGAVFSSLVAAWLISVCFLYYRIFMSSVIGHAMAGIAIGPRLVRVRQKEKKGRIFAVAALLAIVPDLDVPAYIAFGSFGIAPHRGVTHTILFAVITSVIAAAAGSRYLRLTMLRTFVLALGVLLSHLALDYLMGCGTPLQLLWPFSKTGYLFPYKAVPTAFYGLSAGSLASILIHPLTLSRDTL